MGLDVYLYDKATHEQNQKHNAEWEALYNREESGEITQEQYDAERMTITPYPGHRDVASAKHPEHLFNRRYLRSSYNGGGFNRAVPDFVGEDHDLYWIFEPMGREWDGDTGELTGDDIPKLRECKKRAEQVADELRRCDPLRVITVSPNQLSGAGFLEIDSAGALRLVREKIEQHKASEREDDGWWSSRDMEWFGGTLKVIAMVPGGKRRLLGDGKWPCVHVVYRAEGEGFDSYVAAAEITAEFCGEAIGLIEQDGGAYISWSG